jgi:hypothetical protein
MPFPAEGVVPDSRETAELPDLDPEEEYTARTAVSEEILVVVAAV